MTTQERIEASEQLKKSIKEVQMAKADKAFWSNVKTYGSEWAAIRATDSISREEAIWTLSLCQPVSVFKRDGKVIVQ